MSQTLFFRDNTFTSLYGNGTWGTNGAEISWTYDYSTTVYIGSIFPGYMRGSMSSGAASKAPGIWITNTSIPSSWLPDNLGDEMKLLSDQ